MNICAVLHRMEKKLLRGALGPDADLDLVLLPNPILFFSFFLSFFTKQDIYHALPMLKSCAVLARVDPCVLCRINCAILRQL